MHGDTVNLSLRLLRKYDRTLFPREHNPLKNIWCIYRNTVSCTWTFERSKIYLKFKNPDWSWTTSKKQISFSKLISTVDVGQFCGVSFQFETENMGEKIMWRRLKSWLILKEITSLHPIDCSWQKCNETLWFRTLVY